MIVLKQIYKKNSTGGIMHISKLNISCSFDSTLSLIDTPIHNDNFPTQNTNDTPYLSPTTLLLAALQ